MPAANLTDEDLGPRLLQTRVLDHIRADILNRRHKPGERLKIRTLADELGVSTMPVREALRHLLVEGLVQSSPHVGVTVSALSLADVEELYRIRLPLELQASELAMVRFQDPDYTALRRLIKGMEKADPFEWLALNRRFHLSLYALADSPRLLRIISSLWDTLEPYLGVFISTVGRDLDKPNREHLEILDGFASKDFRHIEQVTRVHLLDTKSIVRDALASPDGRSIWDASARNGDRPAVEPTQDAAAGR